MSMRVMICTCESAYQDKIYGKMMRLFNVMKKDGMYRCSICGREK